MKMLRKVFVSCLLALATPGLAHAVTILSDGSIITRNDPSDGTDAIQLDNGSTARIESGGSAVNTGTQPGSDGVFARNGSDVTVSGGTVTGRSGGLNGGTGVSMRGGVLDVFSGDISGGTGSNFAGRGIQITNDGEFSMSGGTVTGGFGTNEGGVGIGVFGTSTTSITGGSISGGTNALGERGYSIWSDSSAEIVLRGGEFSGDFLVSGRSLLTIFGSNLDFNRSTRSLTGILQNGDELDLLLFKAPDAFLNLVEVPVSTPVPLPASVLLLLGGCAAMVGVQRINARRTPA